MESAVDGGLAELATLFWLTAARYLLIAGLAFGLVYLLLGRRLTRAKIQVKYVGSHEFLRDIGHSLVTCAVFAVMAFGVFFTPISPYTLLYKDINAYPLWWIPGSFVMSLVIHDTYFYWMHRVMHHPRFFRIVHRVHHKSINPSPWASYSFNMIEAVGEGFIIIILAFALPMHSIAYLMFIILGLVINVYGHLGYEICPRWFRHTIFFEFVNTSVYHNLHHSKFRGNYTLYFRCWDRICGTENPDYVKEFDRVQRQRFGEKAEVRTVYGYLRPRLQKLLQG